jgi:hemerythrin
VWSDRYACGFAPMDRHHEEFVSLLAAMDGCARAALPCLMHELLVQCERHFEEENELMLATECPAADCHIAEHDAVLASVREVCAIIEPARQAAVAQRLVEQLRVWFEAHVTHLDSAVAQWVVRRRLGGIPVVVRRNLRVELEVDVS